MFINTDFIKTVLNGLLAKINNKADESSVLQSDWNQNDSSVIDYVKNRTHYDSRVIKETTISYDGRELDINDVVTDGGLPFFKFDDSVLSVSDIIGAQVTIEDYTTEIKLETIRNNDSFWVITTGGHAIMCIIKENQDHPFALGKTPGLWCRANQSPSGTFIAPSISITYTRAIGELKKLDAKYLPDDMYPQSDWNNVDEGSLAHILNRPFYDDIVHKTYIFDNVPPSGQAAAILGEIDNDAEFIEGETYIVTVNGTEYNLVARDLTRIELETNKYIYIDMYGQSKTLYGFGWWNNGSTISVAGPMHRMKKIDEKFFSSAVWEVLVDTTLTEAATFSSGVPLETKEAFIALAMPKSTDGSGRTFTNKTRILGLWLDDSIPLQKPDNCVTLYIHVWKIGGAIITTGLITSEVLGSLTTTPNFSRTPISSDSYVQTTGAGNVRIDIANALPAGTVMYIAIRR